MPSSSSQSRIDRNTYIPPHVEQAMTQHMQSSMPAHLKKYVGQNAAYVPQHMQAALSQQMQKNMPGHLKQYAGAYMQQKVVQPNTTRLHGPAMPQGPRFMTNPKAPDPLRRGHSMPVGEQHTVELNTLPRDKSLFQADASQPVPAQPNSIQPNQPVGPDFPAAQEQPGTGPGPNHPTYEFIMNPEQTPKKSRIPGSNSSMAVRVGIAAAGLLVLLVAFTIIKGLLTGGSALPAFVSIAQDQQELIHLAGNAAEEQDLSTDNQNFAATAQLSLGSSQSELVQYLAKNGQKIDIKQLGLKISAKTDEQLTTAAAATTYNQTFKEIMQSKLTDYMSKLQDTYKQTKGEVGRSLLNKDYKQAQLLVTQLNGSTTN